MTAEQKARDLLERMGMPGAQGMTAGDVVELANLIVTHTAMKAVLRDARRFIEIAGINAEAEHDNPEGALYMEGSQYEIMLETQDILQRIDKLLNT